jgi:hypothetical protein
MGARFQLTQTKPRHSAALMQKFFGEELGKAYAKKRLDFFTSRDEGTGFGDCF